MFHSHDAGLAVLPARPVAADARVPGSKSLTNRYLLLAALAEGATCLHHPLASDDTRFMRQALQAAGLQISQTQTQWSIDGRKRWHHPEQDIVIGNAGTAMRFLTPAFARLHQPVTIDGNARMRLRPIADLADGLQQMQTKISYGAKPGYPPLTVTGPLQPPLNGQPVTVKGNASSQYLSGLLMIAPTLDKPLTLKVEGRLVSQTYVAMTIACMAQFDVAVQVSAAYDQFTVTPQPYRATDIRIEPDASTASYWFALPLMIGGRVRVRDVPDDSTQGDFGLLGILAQMGATVDRHGGHVTVQPPTNGPLQGVDVDMNTRSDVAPTLAAIATRANSPTTIRNIGNMRIKECDRIACLQTAFDALGLHMESGPDWMRIYPGSSQHNAVLDPQDDHRMAMVFALLGLADGAVVIKDPQCVAKTYPNFYKDFSAVLAPR